jgi:hypothetical protein
MGIVARIDHRKAPQFTRRPRPKLCGVLPFLIFGSTKKTVLPLLILTEGFTMRFIWSLSFVKIDIW